MGRKTNGLAKDLTNDLKDINKLNRKINSLSGKKTAKKVSVKTSLNSQTTKKKWFRKIALTLLIYYLIIPPFLFPFSGTITSGYFFRQTPENDSPLNIEFHHALDIAAPEGTPVRAAKSGIVTSTGYSEISGNYAIVSHWLGFSTYYGHLLEEPLNKGSIVVKGISRIGKVGSTGRSTGPHTHFELRWRRIPLPPGLFLVFHSVRKIITGI